MKFPVDLVFQLKDTYNLSCFIEGGTYRGDTALWASKYFNEVITIEAQEEIYSTTQKKYEHLTNVDFRFGNTREVLAKIMPTHDKSSLFWLDAHWSVGDTYGEDDECPILDELQIIAQSSQKHFIFIDDARLFLSPPAKPHKIENWPTISQIIHKLEKFQYPIYIIIFDDIIVCVPEEAQELVAEYYQAVETERWYSQIPATTPETSKSLIHKIKRYAKNLLKR